ncbi:MAG: hypothetical protein IKN76_03265 [Oscillospiraceae bacterium]|nr:hypothetical protein [Oscillospiraceae bacterium]
MVKLELELSDIDYDQLLNTFLPKMQEKLGPNSALSSLLGGGLAGSLMSMAGNSTKDKLAAQVINMNSETLGRKMEEMAAKNGIPGKVRNLKATAVPDR